MEQVQGNSLRALSRPAAAAAEGQGHAKWTAHCLGEKLIRRRQPV